MTMTPEQIHEKFQKDRFATQVVGIEIVEARPGYARTKLLIEPKHYNAVGVVQGGVVFTLADFAFAVASNMEDEVVLSIETDISFIKPTIAGTLYAEAQLISRSKSLQSYDVPVTNDKGELVAKFYGRGFVRTPR